MYSATINQSINQSINNQINKKFQNKLAQVKLQYQTWSQETPKTTKPPALNIRLHSESLNLWPAFIINTLAFKPNKRWK